MPTHPNPKLQVCASIGPRLYTDLRTRYNRPHVPHYRLSHERRERGCPGKAAVLHRDRRMSQQANEHRDVSMGERCNTEGIETDALPSHTIDRDHCGHMWLHWDESETNSTTHRGFIPDISEIPPEFGEMRRWREYFPLHSVRGLMIRDDYGASFAREYPDHCLHHKWQLSSPDLLRLTLRCYLPPGEDSRPEGRYSWNEARTDWDNCSSWVLKILDHIFDKANFVTCPRPKRLSWVIRAIWGEHNHPAV